jgi:5-methylcytosine-specific restriction endonuclease McrA
MPKGIYKRGIIHRKPHSEATMIRMSLVAMGKPKSETHIKNIKLAKTGCKYPNRKKYFKGISIRTKICEFCKKEYIANYKNFRKVRFCSRFCGARSHPHKGMTGKKGSEKQREMMRNKKGILHPRWIKDRTKKLEYQLCKNSIEWKNWRSYIFERDKYTCQECGSSGVYIEPHHIIPIKINWDGMFDVCNGITLCRPCHQKTFGKEESFIERYFQILKNKLTKL